MVPIYARAVTQYTTSTASQATLASLFITLLWRGLVALGNRPFPSMSPPNSPGTTPRILKGNSTPKNNPTRFSIKPPSSRPPSPPSVQIASTAAADAHALYDLLSLFPRPIATNKLAREAVDQAFDGWKALIALLEAVQNNAFPKGNQTRDEWETEMEVLTSDLPTLISLPILLRVYMSTPRTVAEILRISEDEYRKSCLHGFGRAEECALTVGQRVLDVLANEASTPGNEMITKWLEAELASADD